MNILSKFEMILLWWLYSFMYNTTYIIKGYYFPSHSLQEVDRYNETIDSCGTW